MLFSLSGAGRIWSSRRFWRVRRLRGGKVFPSRGPLEIPRESRPEPGHVTTSPLGLAAWGSRPQALFCPHVEG